MKSTVLTAGIAFLCFTLCAQPKVTGWGVNDKSGHNLNSSGHRSSHSNSAPINILGPAGTLTAAMSQNNIPCGDNCNGTATVSPVNGTAPYTYRWSTGGTSAMVTGLCTGTYSVTITDALNHTTTAAVTILSSGNQLTLASSAIPTSCGRNNGSAVATVTAGAGPYTYIWSNGSKNQTINNVPPGTYTVMVAGSGGCTATATAVVSPSNPLAAAFNVAQPSCGLSNGSLVCSGLNSAASPFTVQWTENGSFIGNGLSINNLSSGVYGFQITDANNCTLDSNFTFVSTGGTATITADKTTICNNDVAQICGPPGFNAYSWSNGETGMCINAHAAGNYELTVTDNGNCTVVSNKIALNVYPPPAVSLSVNGDTLTSYNGITYQWYWNGDPVTGANSNVYVAGQSGNYWVAITDANGCSAVSNKIAMSVTGIEKVLSENRRIRIYPNPLQSEILLMETGSDFKGSEVQVFDNNGKLIREYEIQNAKLEIKLNVPPGIYFAKIYTSDMILTRKIVKL